MRVMIIEDSPFIAEALVRLVNADAALTVVGHVTNQTEAIHIAVETQAELVVLDLRIPQVAGRAVSPEYGIAALQTLRAMPTPPQVLVFSSLAEKPWLHIVAQHGAIGFVSKDSSSEVILRALRAVQHGMVAFTTEQLHALQQPRVTVSKRERDVLLGLAKGLSNKEIATRLCIEVGTVRTHIENLYAKFDVHSRFQIVAVARRQGLLPLEEG